MDSLNDLNDNYDEPEELKAELQRIITKINEIVTWINNQ